MMSDVTYESVLEQAQRLPWLERQRLLKTLAEEETSPKPKASAKLLPWKDRRREARWLKENARQYVGQWVALEGDQLIAAGTSAIEVRDAAKAVGIERPLLVQVEDPDGPPFAGF
jgi:hypothetical protein